MRYKRIFDKKPFRLFAEYSNGKFEYIGDYYPDENELNIIKNQINLLETIKDEKDNLFNIIVKLHEFHPEHDVQNILFDPNFSDNDVTEINDLINSGDATLFIQDKLKNRFFGNLFIGIIRNNRLTTIFNTNITDNNELAKTYAYNQTYNRYDKFIVLDDALEVNNLINSTNTFSPFKY